MSPYKEKGILLVQSNISLLTQAKELINQLTDRQYTRSKEPSYSSVGKHFRHVIDFYHLFIDQSNSSDIHYGKRKRNPNIENRCLFAIKKIDEAVENFKKKKLFWKEDKKVNIYSSEIPTIDSLKLSSSLFRELEFLVFHTIHHYAIIGLILSQQGVTPPPHFGVATSTMKQSI